MTYPKQLSAYQNQLIAPILAKVEKLSEGETLEFKTNNPKQLRYLLYSHFNINNLKELFRIYDRGNQILIQRLLPIRVHEITTKGLSEAERFILKFELLVKSQDEVENFLAKQPLDPAEKVKILETWIAHQ